MYGQYGNYNCKKLRKWRKNVRKTSRKELGINYYDRELIRMASDESGINEALFGEVDEKLKNPRFSES